MNLKEIKQELDKLVTDEVITDFAYHHFSSKPTLPFAVYLEYDSDAFFGDNRTINLTYPIRLELYTDFKDEDLEERILKAFKKEPIKKEASIWLERENCYLTIFDIY